MTQTAAPTPSASRQGLLLGALIFALAGLIFLPALSGEFVYDDLLLVANNPRLDGFGSVVDAFSRSYWEGYDAESAGEVGYWRPLSTVALILGKAIGGGSPQGFHIVSLVLHALCSALLFSFVRRLTQSDLIAFFSGLLFAWHPVHVESVAWISGIGDLAAGVFIVGMLERWLAWRERGSPGLPLASAALFLCGVLAKEGAIAGLPLLLVVDLLRPNKTSAPGASGRAIACLSMTFALYVLTRMAVFGSVTAGLGEAVTDFGVSSSRLATLRVELLGGYLQLLALPLELNLFRPFRPVIAETELIAPLVWIVSFAVIVLVARKRGLKEILLPALCIPAALLPAIVFVNSLGAFPLSDRYAYLAVFGLSTALSLALGRSASPLVAGSILSLFAGGYAWQTLDRIPFWQNETALFEESVAQNPKTPYVRWGLGRVLLSRYQELGEEQDLERAREQYDEAMNLLEAAATSDFEIFATKKDHLESNLGLGWTLLYEAESDPFRDFTVPLKQFERTAAYAPGSSNALVGQGISLFLGGQHDQAALKVREALKINPGSFSAHVAMGRILFHLGDSERSTESFAKALELKPGHLSTLLLYVGALEQTLNEENAVRVLGQMESTLLEAQRLHPEAGEPLRMLGVVSVNRGNTDEALRRFDQAIALNPEDAFVHQLKGQLLLGMDDKKGSLRSFMKSADLDVNNFTSRYYIATILAASSDPDPAVPYFIHAYTLRPPVPNPIERDPAGDSIRAELLRLVPDDAAIFAKLGEIDLARGELYRETARQWIDLSLKTSPQYTPALVLRARMRLDDAETPEQAEVALGDYERATQLTPEYFDAQYELGLALMERGRGAEALPHLKAALEFIGNSTMTKEQIRDIEPALRARVMALDQP